MAKHDPCIDCGTRCRGKRCRKCHNIYCRTDEYRQIKSISTIKSHSRPEVRRKISEKVRAAHARGDLGEEWRQKLSAAQRKAYRDRPEIGQKRSKSMKAAHARGTHRHIYTEELRRKNSETSLGFWQNPDFRQKQLAIYNSPEYKEKQSRAKRGAKNPQWKGGASFGPYGLEFDEPLRKFIRERDNYQCAVCGKHGKSVHHIDDDKLNNDPSNLITLCKRHHGMTITGNRDYWQAYFTGKDYELYLGVC